jgi:protein-S-isoprenylcysteine O-methyltransferase Ste14
MVDADDDSARVTFPPPIAYLGTLLAGLLADWLFGLQVPLSPTVRIVAVLLLLVAGSSLVLAARNHFVRAGTDVKPWKTSSAIVSDGVYAFTRNPMYLGMALVYLGIALGFASMSALVLLPLLLVVVHTHVIAREERYLEAKFGDLYREYRTKVRRWL